MDVIRTGASPTDRQPSLDMERPSRVLTATFALG